MAQQPSISEGSFAFSYSFFNGTRDQPRLVCRVPLENGLIYILTREDQLILELVSIGEQGENLLDQWISPHLLRCPGQPMTVFFVWQAKLFVSFRINSREISRNCESEKLILNTEIWEINLNETNVPSSHPATIRNESGANGRRMRHLRQTVERLEWALENLTSGRFGAILDISVALRGMLTTGNPTLIRAANDVGYDLIVYSPMATKGGDNFSKLGEMGATAIEVIATAIPSHPDCVEVPLEDWLKWPALLIGGEPLAHWQLIYNLAGQFGAHGDIEKIEQLEHFLNQHYAGVDLGALNSTFKQYAELTVCLARRLLHLFGHDKINKK